MSLSPNDGRSRAPTSCTCASIHVSTMWPTAPSQLLALGPQAAERGAHGGDQVLVNRIGEESVRRLGHVGAEPRRLAAAIACRERGAPGAEAPEPAELARALQTRQRDQPGGVAQEGFVGGEDEGREGDTLDPCGGAVTDPEADGAAVVGGGGGGEPRRGVGAEQELGRRAQPAASPTAARYSV